MYPAGGSPPTSKPLLRNARNPASAHRCYAVSKGHRGYPPGQVTRSQPNERRSWLARFAFHPDGRLRGWRLLGLAAAAALVLSIGGVSAVVLAITGSPDAIPMWVMIAFVTIKLPLLALLWWLLSRRRPQESDAMSAAQASLAIERLRGAADRVSRQSDAWDRLDGLAEEARFVATHSPPQVADEARALADQLAARRDLQRPAGATLTPR